MRIALLILVVLFSKYTSACSCVRWPKEVEDAAQAKFDRSESVVLAEVEGTVKVKIASNFGDENYEHNGEETHFSTIKSWKGSHGKHFYTRVITDCCMCGLTFEKGEKYLIYMYESKEKGFYKTSICSGNQHYKYAEEEMKALDNISPNKSLQPTANASAE